ncbi:MAG: PEP-CTERM sorting domain-containing protein [Kiritimatiellae bacterium]|nr:PEP-CTERM sorting domain-containing protein [Kiritimatiellia bacterium]
MKKLMMAVAVALVAVATQAASFYWGTAAGGAKLVDADNNVLTAVPGGGKISLILLGSDTTSYTDATWLMDATFTTSTKASTNGRINNNYGFSWTDGGDNIIDNGDILAVVFKDADGKFSNLKNAADGSDLIARTTLSGINGNNWSNITSSWTFTSANYSAVPEPTSGLLLLLGVAGLALKRKRA